MTTPEMEEVVAEWLSMADSYPQPGGLIRYPPVCPTELDAIRALLSERRKMVEALEPFAKWCDECVPPFIEDETDVRGGLMVAHFRAARAALTGSKERD